MPTPRILVTLSAAVLLVTASAPGKTENPLVDEALRAVARAGEPRAQLQAAPLPPRPAAASSRGGLFLFVSRGMPAAELQAALAEAAADPTLTLILRGLLPGERLDAALPAIARLIARHDPPPAILIDPGLYRRHEITAVPTLLDPATGHRLQGAISRPALERERRHAGRIDLGRTGPTWPIAEPDLAEVLKARVANLDLPAQAEAALARFWRQAPAVALPPAQSSTTRRFRPEVRTSSDLHDDRRRRLLPAGSLINPLRTLPLTARILVLDAQDPHEIAWARTQRHSSRATIHLITNPDREGGWSAWQALQQELDAPPFLLDRHLADRLRVRATPSLIEAEGTELVVHEIALPRTRAEHDR
ncbi:MAG: TrbC family F-type conjugative pilus assembly protein [Parvibaculaceae bacterium]